MKLRNINSISDRRKLIEENTGVDLSVLGVYPKNLDKAQYRNCENMIGATQIPLGIAGPVKINGKYAQGDFFLPLATTEGALVASVNRGAKATYLSGGVNVYTKFHGITRSAMFEVEDLSQAVAFKIWLDQNCPKIKSISKSTSTHLELLNYHVKIVGRHIYVRFSFDSQDAMGMNMVTIAVSKIVDFINSQLKLKNVAVAGNFDIDKKPAWLNFIMGRGREVWAEAVVKKDILKKVLKIQAEKFHKVTQDKCLLGSIISGSLGFNAHYANIIAAFFIACGQDLAHTVEGSMGITTTNDINGDLYISINLPSLIVGTVGGGTGLEAQKSALELLGIKGGNSGQNAAKLSEIIAASVLCGELSLLASISEGSLAAAHQKLARGEKK